MWKIRERKGDPYVLERVYLMIIDGNLNKPGFR
ncbi:hypothetical protein SAMN05518856_12573 [Paenibacillus sp. OK003]|nr:hypothetical protein SAMN05518856_12573 [Paenibacillus sp. OK003]